MRGLPRWAASPWLSRSGLRLLSAAATLPLRRTAPLRQVLRSRARLEDLRKTVPLHEPWRAPDADSLDSQSLRHWIDRNTSPGQGRQLLEYLLASYFAPTAESISLLYALHVLNTWGGLAGLFAAQSSTLRFEGGAQSLSLAMAEYLGKRVRLGSAVRRIAKVGMGYSVMTQRDEFRARHVVVAVPPKNTIEFQPELPASPKDPGQRLAVGVCGENQRRLPRTILATQQAHRGRFGPPRRAGCDRHVSRPRKGRLVELRGGGTARHGPRKRAELLRRPGQTPASGAQRAGAAVRAPSPRHRGIP